MIDNIDNLFPESNTPPPISVAEPDIACTPDESETRLEFCKNCDNFIIEEGTTRCKSSGCLINLMTTFKFKTCPKGFW